MALESEMVQPKAKSSASNTGASDFMTRMSVSMNTTLTIALACRAHRLTG